MRFRSLPALSRRALSGWRGLLARPSHTGIVHLGLGNFHRAHQAVYTSEALRAEPGPWGILAATNSSRRLVSALAAQDLLYSVAELSPSGVHVSVPSVHTGLLIAAEDPAALVAAIAAPATRIVTLTVTESGYSYSPESQGLALDSPDIRYDLENPSTPRTPIGVIARGLHRRMTAGLPGLTVLSCDNLVANGRRTRRLVREFVEAMRAPELLQWIDQHVTFPGTMVDRIVPATTDALRALVSEKLHVLDAVPVPAEPFSMWVLEDDFAAGRPRWEAGGAIFCDQVGPYEVMKLRLLNGTHGLIAYLGLLAGQEFIAEAIRVPFVEEAARRMIAEDLLPLPEFPDGVDLPSYVDQLFERFRNEALGHRTVQVASDGSLKLPQRIGPAILDNRRAGRMPQLLALAIAAYVCCVAPLDGQLVRGAEQIRDPALPRLRALATESTSIAGLVTAVFQRGEVFDAEIGGDTEFVARVAELARLIRVHGVARAVADTVV
ncbi:mannitol dehydrogenase family protein [Fodinicola acaciae]|uniref:mannitol dehydrogenase family protein n=1 Tax=Fodinicola acaciae TaxID=2681555 RepID=UPI0013D03F42|nr:mannitol dehydrogenase family protein [Fodinicola acaciae]